MALNLTTPQPVTELKPRIVVVGVGGAGGNAVNNMIRSNLEGVEFIVANTDAQALEHSAAERRIQLGSNITQGLGAGARPEVGRAAAEEALDEVMDQLTGANMVFITAGMGGGTGTGAAPVIAEASRRAGILTVGVITKPFHFEGSQRMKLAEQGIEELQGFVDTLIIIPNQNLFRVANEKTTFADAFKMADDVLYSGVRGVTDLMVMPGLINLDFADIRTVMGEMGKAMMGTGESEGESRAISAAEAAISNPLLEDVTMHGARGVLINITGGGDMTLFEVDEAANRIREEVDPEANIIFGSTFDETLEGTMRVSVVATGIEGEHAVMPRPLSTPKPTPAPQPTVDEAPAADEQAPIAAVQETEPAPVAEAPVMAEAAIDEQPAAQAESQAVESTLFDMNEAPAAQAAPQAPQAPAQQPLIRPTPAQEAAVNQPLPRPDAVPTRDAFIPPTPAQPENMMNESAGQPDPFVEADFANAGHVSQSAKKKPNNIFRRMTGLMGQREDYPKTEAAVQNRSEPGLRTAQSEKPAAATSPEEEMLEIPAFLRRQAN